MFRVFYSTLPCFGDGPKSGDLFILHVLFNLKSSMAYLAFMVSTINILLSIAFKKDSENNVGIFSNLISSTKMFPFKTSFIFSTECCMSFVAQYCY